MAHLTLKQIFELAVARQQDGRLSEAEKLYRQILAIQPDHGDTLHNLGALALQAERHDEAAQLLGRAVVLLPHSHQAHSNLAIVLRKQGKLEAAIAELQKAIAINPNSARAYSNLGDVLKEKGQLDEAIAAYRRGMALDESVAELHSNLGNLLKQKGQVDEAICEYQRAIELHPKFADAYNNLGNTLREQGAIEPATAALRRAIELKPGYALAYNNLAIALSVARLLDEAAAAARRAIEFRYDNAQAHSNLGTILKDQGRLDEAIEAYRQAVSIKPDDPDADSNLVYALHFHGRYDAAAIAEEHRRWNRQHGQPLKRFIKPHENDRDPDRALRIGYVSPDFGMHPVGRFVHPLIASHDHGKFDIFCYSSVAIPDPLTSAIRSHADVWREARFLSDEPLAELIREDRIDILVDLTMHMAGSRLLVFARKPAPVQVAYLAYCSTTGLETIDWRISDPHLDPPGMDESIYSERTIRLPATYWCYEAPIEGIEVSALPAGEDGSITFGCLNNFCKISAEAARTWAELLQAVPRSRLLVHADPGSHRQRLIEQFTQASVDPARVQFVPTLSLPQYLRQYQRIDIALDPFPYVGGTTTCDALWMGVPVVSLRGHTAVGRGGVSILSNIGLGELIADDPRQYIEIAAQLANNLPGLSHLRSTLRERMMRSRLMDGPQFARDMEAIYRRIWREWCKTGGSGV